MAFSIQTNVNSLVAQENLRVNSDFQSRTISRLTSGFRINASGDDAAGLAVANKFRSDVAELQQGVRNANDGLSTLQIIDGGLNNVSTMLDRLKTLATQSASSTFNGNRATLNNEYQALLGEIDRQAGNIGLGSGSFGGRFNTSISVYTGGGGELQENSKVMIDLSGSANRVNSSALALSGTSINSGATTTFAGMQDLTSVTKLYEGNGAQASQAFSFHIVESDGTKRDFTMTVKGTSDSTGITTDEALTQLNDVISQYGLSATTATNGAATELAFTGGVAFSVEIAAEANAAGGSFALTAAGAAAGGYSDTMYTNKTNANVTSFTGYAAGNSEDLTFKVGTQQVSFQLNSTNAATLGATVDLLNSKLNTLGIKAVQVDNPADATSHVVLQSDKSFTYSGTHTEADDVFDATSSIFVDTNMDASGTNVWTLGAGTAVTADSPSNASASDTSSAEAALSKITDAVETLGLVQGKVGTGQNKLQYAITLAQSQISNFSAAESRIRDADVAAEAANLTKAQVLQQASLAAMAQANSAPQAVLALLRG
ncbi:MAG TPA: flagellin [Bryobacteraceae bacterium]|nr:flagellin [Bryobacteraceae bacterium]